MMKRVLDVCAMSTLAVLLLLCAAGRSVAQGPAKAESNRQMIEKQARGILFMAHPTVTLTAASYDQTTTFQNGAYALTFKFTWKNAFDQDCYRYWHFHFTKEGTISQIEDGKTDTVFPPFALNDAVLKAIKDDIREQMRTGKLNENDPVAKLILATPDMRKCTVLLLQLNQN
jgi:hypothetical protein